MYSSGGSGAASVGQHANNVEPAITTNSFKTFNDTPYPYVSFHMIHNIVSYRIIPTYYHHTYYMTHMYHRYKSLVFLGVLRFGTHAYGRMHA